MTKSPVVVGASLALALCPSLARPAAAQSAQERPRLVVMIAVDQLRADLLDRYAPAFTGGFRRFLDDGFRYTGASHAHAATETAVGHATLSTGTFPARSGIVGNDWSQRAGGAWAPMYAVADSASPILGVDGLEGRSPRNLLRTGLADWVLAADPEARSVSISTKDRAAITMAGRSRAEVYWLLTPLGRFVTSTYYHDAYPDWVTRFNETRMPGILADTVWTSRVPERYRHLARPDSAPWEGDGVHTAFPHLASAEAAPGVLSYNAWALEQPRQDRAVQLLAQEAVRALRLGGRRGHTDYLGVSFSATDYVGHAFGPFSQEQLDNLLHLDRRLGELLGFLDREVGRGRWVAALSADHGVMTTPEWLVASGEDPDARRVDARERAAALQAALQDAAAEVGTGDALAERLARLVEERGLVARAYTARQLTVGELPDSFATLFRNSWYPGRAGGLLSRFGVEIRYPPNHLVGSATGTTHGSVYWYDRHVPFLLLGAGVRRGASDEAVYTVDVAPTLALLAGVPTPDDLDGRPVYR